MYIFTQHMMKKLRDSYLFQAFIFSKVHTYVYVNSLRACHIDYKVVLQRDSETVQTESPDTPYCHAG